MSKNWYFNTSTLYYCHLYQFFWHCAITFLALSWHSPGILLAFSWYSPGTFLALSWYSSGTILVFCWHSSGTLLALFWLASLSWPYDLKSNFKDIIIKGLFFWEKWENVYITLLGILGGNSFDAACRRSISKAFCFKVKKHRKKGYLRLFYDHFWHLGVLHFRG